MAKDPRYKFEHSWLFDPLEQDGSFYCKHMFGGLATYYRGRLVAVLMQEGKKNWRGLLIPTERAHHASLQTDLPSLKPHPVLGKWLYLSQEEAFEQEAEEVVKLIRRNDIRIGVLPKPKKKK
jgi:hypothetical protein